MNHQLEKAKGPIHKHIDLAHGFLNKLQQMMVEYPGGPSNSTEEGKFYREARLAIQHTQKSWKELTKLFDKENRKHILLVHGREIRLHSMRCPSCSKRGLRIRGKRPDGTEIHKTSLYEKDDPTMYKDCKVSCLYCQDNFGPIAEALLKSKDRRKLIKQAKQAERIRTRARAAIQVS